MKNLQSFGVQELNIKEIKETDGGIIPLLVVGCLFLVGCTDGCSSDNNNPPKGGPNNPPEPDRNWNY